MAYYGEVPWHGLGKRVPKGVTAEQMIQAAGLDWKVELRPARGAREINKKGEFSRYEVVRVPRPNTKEGEALLGVVSRRYKPLQNIEAFQFFDPIVSHDGAQDSLFGDNKERACFETAGALGEGERIWVMAKMPDAMVIVRGDECWKYLLLSNTHTGDGSVTVKFTSVRVVCQNTLMLAMKDRQKAYRVRHSNKMQPRLKELAKFLAITQKVYLKAEEDFRRLAHVHMIEDRLEHYFESVFPRTKAQKKNGENPPRWAYLQGVFESQPDLQLPGVRGTLWGAYNAITRFEDYKQPQQEEQPDQRLERTWFGSGADIKLLALQRALEFAKTWKN
jgi:phage/plasmid-like protein (TIGR03299 family)